MEDLHSIYLHEKNLTKLINHLKSTNNLHENIDLEISPLLQKIHEQERAIFEIVASRYLIQHRLSKSLNTSNSHENTHIEEEQEILSDNTILILKSIQPFPKSGPRNKGASRILTSTTEREILQLKQEGKEAAEKIRWLKF